MRCYRGLLGFEVVTRFEWATGSERFDAITDLDNSAARAAMLRLGNAFIELFEYTSPTPKPAAERRPVCDHGITHVALVVDDVQAEYERLKAAGMVFHCAPTERMRATYGRDPDGNVVEIMQIDPGSRIALDAV